MSYVGTLLVGPGHHGLTDGVTMYGPLFVGGTIDGYTREADEEPEMHMNRQGGQWVLTHGIDEIAASVDGFPEDAVSIDSVYGIITITVAVRKGTTTPRLTITSDPLWALVGSMRVPASRSTVSSVDLDILTWPRDASTADLLYITNSHLVGTHQHPITLTGATDNTGTG